MSAEKWREPNLYKSWMNHNHPIFSLFNRVKLNADGRAVNIHTWDDAQCVIFNSK